MTESEIKNRIGRDLAGAHVSEDRGSWFFMPDPEAKFPLVTLVTTDAYDSFSLLDRPGIFRVNLGLSREDFFSLFGAPSGSGEETKPDFTATDVLMPHPVYGSMFWACILNPSRETYESKLKPLLEKARRRLGQMPGAESQGSESGDS